MKININLTIRHLYISIAIIVSGIIGLISGKLIFESKPDYTETIIKTTTHTIKEPITVTGGILIEPTLAVFLLFGAVIMALMVSRWN